MPVVNIASLWKPDQRASERTKASGRSIDVSIIIPAGSRLKLLTNKSDHQKSPEWDLVLVTDDPGANNSQQRQPGDDGP